MLGIMNAALVSVGLDEIVSEYDGTAEVNLMLRNWPGIVESELEAGLYEFSKQQADLVSRIEGKFGRPDGFLIPAAALFVRHVWTLNQTGARVFSTDWVSDGVAVYLDSAEGCTIEYISVPDPSVWSANFSRGVQFALEAALCRMEGDETAARDADMRSREAVIIGRGVAAKSRAARPLTRTSSFATARFGRGAR